jgi:hypothetical protein
MENNQESESKFLRAMESVRRNHGRPNMEVEYYGPKTYKILMDLYGIGEGATQSEHGKATKEPAWKPSKKSKAKKKAKAQAKRSSIKNRKK